MQAQAQHQRQRQQQQQLAAPWSTTWDQAAAWVLQVAAWAAITPQEGLLLRIPHRPAWEGLRMPAQLQDSFHLSPCCVPTAPVSSGQINQMMLALGRQALAPPRMHPHPHLQTPLLLPAVPVPAVVRSALLQARQQTPAAATPAQALPAVAGWLQQGGRPASPACHRRHP